MPEILLKPVPNAEAAKFIADKPVVSREVFAQLLPDIQARAFTIKGVEDANLVQAVRDRIAEIPAGADWDQVKQDIAGKISPWLDQGEGNEGRAEKRAELLMRTHGYQAYSVAQHEVMDRQRAAFPYWQYATSDDDRVRDSHAALDGLVLPADSPFWATHFPPWDFGCRCQAIPLTEDDVKDIQAADEKKKPEEHRVLDADRLRELENSGMVNRALPGEGGLPRRFDVNRVEREGAYSFDPASLKMDAAALSKRYDPEVWQNFENFARNAKLADGRTVLSWLNDAPPAPAKKARKVKKVEAPAAVKPPAPPPVVEDEAEPFMLSPSTAENNRQAIRETKFTGERDLSSGVNQTVLLINGKKVVFKAGDGERQSLLRRGITPGTQYKREVAASILDEELGIGLVPPTTLLTYQGREGSAQLFMENFKPAASVRNLRATLDRLTDRQKHDWQLFDELSRNLDRHANNYMLRLRSTRVDLTLIDHGLTFSTESRAAGYRGGLLSGRSVDETNLRRVRSLLDRETAIRDRLEPLLEPAAINLLFTRARSLIKRGTYVID